MIELKNVSFYYNQDKMGNGLLNINLKVNKGEVVLLTGESGCGKTTITRLINGLIPNYYEGNLTGEVIVKKKVLNELPLYETSKIVGSVFQNPRSQFFNVDTTSEIAFGCENKGLPVEEIKRRVFEAVKEFNIESLLDKSIFNLSGGEKQKIACASVSACYPEILVLDEPSSNLDVNAIEDLRKMIFHWKKEGKTIVIAEHRLYFLSELADRIIYIKNGAIEREFSNKELKDMSFEQISNMGLRPFSLKQFKVESNVKEIGKDTIELNDFIFSYKFGSTVINIDSVSVPRKSIVAVIGHNGAGKSTFARCLCGLEKRCKGILTLNGKRYKSKDRLKCCYMVMQDVNHQLFTEGVLDEVLLSIDKDNTDYDKNVLYGEKILDGLNLTKEKHLHPMSLSGGQKQRVAIASAVASKRDIVLFDEPTSGLDLSHMKSVANNLKQLQGIGKTLFVISHDLELILSCCTHVLHIERGKVIENYAITKNNKEKLLSFFTNYIGEEK